MGKDTFKVEGNEITPAVKNPSKALRNAYITALSLVLISLVTGQIMIQITIESLSEDSKIINIAGRQRMLSQKITKIALIYSESSHKKEILVELDTIFKTFEQVHYGLQNGDIALGIANWENPPQIKALFNKMDPHFLGMKKGVEQLLFKSKNGDSENGINLLITHESPFLILMNSIVKQYELNSKGKLGKLQFIEFILLIAAILVLIFEAFFIFKPSLTTIKKGFNAIQEKNEELSQSKNLLEQQKEELKILSLVAREVGNGVIITDDKGKTVWVNKGFTKISGYSLSDMINKKPGDVLQGPETNSETILTIREKLKKREAFYIEILNYHKMKMRYWTELHITPIFDENGKLERFISVQNDITLRKNMETHLNDSFHKLQTKTKKINSSINYAKKIQQAFLPTTQKLSALCDDHFVVFMPKDTVSGDFYWATSKKGYIFLAAVDCTGHGVPGALMSTIGNSLLNKIVEDHGITSPDRILELLHRGVNYNLQQEEKGGQDGMDMAICVINKEKKTIEFAGANNPLFAVLDEEPIIIKGDRRCIGGKNRKGAFKVHTLSFQKSANLYLLSDGYQDQFGNNEENTPKIKIGRKRLQELIFKNSHLPMENQASLISDYFQNWKGEEKQIDDVLVMGATFN